MKIFKILSVFCIVIISLFPSVGICAWKQNQFIITHWCPPPPTIEALSSAKNEGFNLTWALESKLDIVQKQGLNVMLSDELLTPSTLDNPGTRKKLDELISRVKNHPSLEAYILADEPGATDFPGLGKLVAYLRERDPNHVAYINLFPIYATNKHLGTKGTSIIAYQEYLRRFITEVKPSLISFDHYFFFKAHDGDQYFINLEMIRQVALENSLPFINIIQASTIEKNWRLVDKNELRWLIYTTLAYGARGISYFLYWGPTAYGGLYQDGKKTPLVDMVSLLNREISALSVILMDLDSLGIYHAGTLPTGTKVVPITSPVQFVGPGNFVLGLFGKNKIITTFMVVNRDYKNQATAQIALKKDISRIEEFDKVLKSWIVYKQINSKNIISAVLNPGDGRMFRILP